MKQHITPQQAMEITEQQFYSLFNEVVKRKDWANYHHKKITIGKMIEYLRTTNFLLLIQEGQEGVSDYFVQDESKDEHVDEDAIYHCEELVDALWEAVKSTLNKRTN